MSKLKTAVIGLDERGQSLLQSLTRLPDVFELTAVADTEGDAAQAAGIRYKVSSFDDLRRMLVQTDLDVIISAAPLHNSIECLQAAMKKGCHVLKYHPAARSFDEAAVLLRIAKENSVFFATAGTWKHRRSAQAMKIYLEKHTDEQFHFVEAWCSSVQPPHHDWQRDPQLASGGAVLNLSYPLIDQITSLFSVPQQVYALFTNQAPDRKQRLSLTEDTAIVSMKFDDRLIGKLVASRTMWPDGWLMRVYGKDMQVTLSDKGFSVRNSKGDLLEEVKRHDSEEVLTDKMLGNFAAAILSGDHVTLEKEPAEILGNMALIQAAYLSYKTGMPEEPARIIQMTNG